MVLEPSAEHVGDIPVIVGTAGVANITGLLNEADEPEVQVPSPAVTV